PETASADIPALRLAASIMSRGESSRLYRELVRNKQIAQQAEMDLELNAEGGRISFIAIASEKGTSEELEKALLEELSKIQKDGVTEKELEKAKNQIITSSLKLRETNDGKAISIERSIVYAGRASAVNEDIQKLQVVTIADIQRVMNKYFKPNNRVVIYYNQEKK
ncbi:MAG TPA: insulinase family protein, partial [Pyrinomonadaceae bacterium]|nr:insulinase family protein [Pyrinomonadaceae bacterium]